MKERLSAIKEVAAHHEGRTKEAISGDIEELEMCLSRVGKSMPRGVHTSYRHCFAQIDRRPIPFPTLHFHISCCKKPAFKRCLERIESGEMMIEYELEGSIHK